MTIQEFDLFKAVNIVADFADWDTTARLNHSLRAYCSTYYYRKIVGNIMSLTARIIMLSPARKKKQRKKQSISTKKQVNKILSSM